MLFSYLGNIKFLFILFGFSGLSICYQEVKGEQIERVQTLEGSDSSTFEVGPDCLVDTEEGGVRNFGTVTSGVGSSSTSKRSLRQE